MFPTEAGKYDKIAVEVKKLHNAKLLTASTYSYKTPEFKEAELKQGDIFTVEYP